MYGKLVWKAEVLYRLDCVIRRLKPQHRDNGTLFLRLLQIISLVTCLTIPRAGYSWPHTHSSVDVNPHPYKESGKRKD